MTGPFPFARQTMDLDTMIAGMGGEGWDGLEAMFKPAGVKDSFDPGDHMKKMLFAFYQTGEGRQVIDWLLDLTFRAPFPHVGTSIEQAAIAAAKHESRAAIGLVIMKAIADGDALLHPQNRS